MYRQTADGCDEPTVAEFTLDQVSAVHTVNEQARIVADLLRTRPTRTHTLWTTTLAYTHTTGTEHTLVVLYRKNRQTCENWRNVTPRIAAKPYVVQNS